MRSPRAHYKRSQRYAALATSLVVHAILFVMLAWVRTTPPPAYEFPPVDVSLLPPLESYSTGAAGGGGGSPGAPGSGLRRLDEPTASASAAAQASAGLRGQTTPTESTPTEVATRPQARETAQITAPTPPTPTELRPAQSLAVAQPQESETLPTLAARVQPLESPLAAANRRTPAPALRPAQALTVEPDRPAEQLAEAVRPQQAPTVAAASRASPTTGLRPAQTLAIDADRPAEALAQAAQTQAPPSVTAAASRPAPTGPLRSAPTLAIDADRPADTLTARAQGPQAPPSVAPAGRPGAAPQLRAAGGLAGPLGPQPPGSGSGQNPALAGGPGLPGSGPGPGGSGSGAAGARAGAHPGCEREILMLLTPAEREKCRDIDPRRYPNYGPSNADAERAARLAAMRAVPYLSNVPPEKRAYYNAVTAAKEAVRNQIGGGRAAGLSCNLSGLFGGPKGGAPSERIKIPGLPCSIIPPTGVLTEEARFPPP